MSGRHWRVGEFRSSSDPDKTVLCVFEGDCIAHHEKHHSFIRWIAGSDIAASQPVGQQPFAWGLIHGGEKRVSIEPHKCDDGTEFDGEFQFPLYAAPPAQPVDLGAMPDGWRLSKKATCYQLSHGNDIIGNLVGPDAEENAAIIARVLDSQAVGNG